MKRYRWGTIWGVAIATSVIVGACGHDENVFVPSDSGNDMTVEDAYDPFANDGDIDADVLTVTPAVQTLTVNVGSPPPTQPYQATYEGQVIAATWSVDRGEVAIIDGSGVLTPTGNVGAKIKVVAHYQGKTGSATLTVKLVWEQNGDPSAGTDAGGAGGSGGVGGEGPGASVDSGTVTTLKGSTVTDPGLKWLYPYDKTVWPRGILAPLLQWQVGAQSDYDAIYIHITENNLDYKGFFKKTATPFIHHPIVQAPWKTLALSNEGEDVTIDLVFAKGGTAYGPITEKWKVARGSLKGTVYYNSYGTGLAKNFCCAFNGAQFGGATLAIKGGSTDPTLIAGNNSECRVCHSVAADGSKLITQHGDDYNTSSAYTLKPLSQTTMAGSGTHAWAGIYPNGTFLFSNSSDAYGSTTSPSGLYSIPSGSAVTSTGLPSGLQAALPAFSGDGKHVAFNYYSNDQRSLAAMDFILSAKSFSGLTVLYTPPSAAVAIWPSFLPTNDAVVFQVETNNQGEFAVTRSGVQGKLYWVDVKTKTARALDNLNGKGYLPTSSLHPDDSALNYEPTVSPVASGGYAWVVFTSRRLYGNVATIDPTWSDPRDHDISATPTTKKLWVAAVDINATPGTDPSHPAFYIPAQELLAGNSRGFWVVDPCKPKGDKCETGDECCDGYCSNAADGGLVCTPDKPPCSEEFDKCTNDADCCGTGKCINGRCAQPTPT